MPNLVQKSCVLAGSLNPAIIFPDWLVTHGVLPLEGEGQLRTDNAGMPWFEAAGFLWMVSLNRLDVRALTDDVDPGEFVAKVIGLLAHTPVAAVGSNFVFGVDSDEGAAIHERLSPSLSRLVESPGHVELEFSATAKITGDNLAVVTATVSGQKAKVSQAAFNFHRQVTNAEQAVTAAQLWRRDQVSAGQLMRRLLAEELA